MNLTKNVKRRLATLSPEKRKWAMTIGVTAAVVIGLFVLSPKTPTKKKDEKLDVEVVTPSKRNVDLENLNAQLAALQRQLSDTQSRQANTEQQLTDKISSLTDQLKQANSPDELAKRVKQEVSKVKVTGGGDMPSPLPAATSLPAPGSVPALNSALPGSSPGAVGIQSSASVIGAQHGIAVASEDEPDTPNESTAQEKSSSEDIGDKAAKAAKKDPEAWFPMGSILSGVALNGGDFPVTSAAKRDPVPMLIRIKKEAILPNNARANVKECFVLVSGSGDMSTSRANLRGERMSCVLQGGRAIEVPISAYVNGEDGKPGLKGALVAKEGEVIAKALRAGMIGALGVGFTGFLGNELSTFNTGSVNVAIGSTSNGAQGQAAAAPVGAAFEHITDYYSTLAKEIVPVVEINPLRQVDIVLVRGVAIPLK